MILITGATGHLGKAVVEQLTRRTAPERVAAFVRDEGKASALKALGVKLRVGSYDDVESGVHELTAHEAWSYQDVAEALTELSGKKVEYVPVDGAAFVATMRERGVPEAVIQRSADFHREVRSGLLDEVSPEMERWLGRRPASLKDGLGTLFRKAFFERVLAR